MIDLQQRVRRAMAWEDRRTWTRSEWEAVKAAYVFRVDVKRGLMVARPLPPAEP